MKLLPLHQLGSHETSNNRIHFGCIFPWISPDNGNRLYVKIIKEEDQFIQNIPAKSFMMTHSVIPVYGDCWSCEITIDQNDRISAASRWGEEGRYVYRYELHSPLLDEPLDWIVDPFAREFGTGRQAAFTLGYIDHEWGSIETEWKTPDLKKLIVYEIMLHEFASDLKGAKEKLAYLKDLGVNCIEIMPVCNVDRSIDWGFESIGLFGVDERFGKRKDMQDFIQDAHEHGIAVVLDMIYGHTGSAFAYEYVYSHLNYNENPFMGAFAKDMFGPSTDFRREFTRDFYFTVNYYWFDRYHIDGVRYDCVPNYYDGFMGAGYANLVYTTWQEIHNKGNAGYWQRFFNDGRFNLIQMAEQLEAPVEIVKKTYTNCTWQNETLGAVKTIAGNNFGTLYNLGMHLGLEGYPETVIHNSDTIEKTALQYLENHDHSRFICSFGTRDLYREVFREGIRENWYKTQPYAIGILLAKGIPMIWQGQEIVENYDVPDSGPARIGTLRPVRWEKFYTHEGRMMLSLYRKLLALRTTEEVFTNGTYYFYNDWLQYQSRGILIFRRSLNSTTAIVCLNFSDTEHLVEFTMEEQGDYTEQLHQVDTISLSENNSVVLLKIPGNYGRVWLKK